MPADDTFDYPSLCVSDGRVSGSITDGASRLPLWAFVGTCVREGWDSSAENWPPHELDAEKFAGFLYNLLEQRGEFGRLICVLADVERREPPMGRAWWEVKARRRRVKAALLSCVAALDEQDAEDARIREMTG